MQSAHTLTEATLQCRKPLVRNFPTGLTWSHRPTQTIEIL